MQREKCKEYKNKALKEKANCNRIEETVSPRMETEIMQKKKTEEDFLNAQISLQKEHQHLVYELSQHADAKLQQQLRENEQAQQQLEEKSNAPYHKLVEKHAPKVPLFQNVARAFLVGGCICVIGQIIVEIATHTFFLEEKSAFGLASACLIILASILTGLGIYDEIGRFGGAGSMVPITGFANSIASAALEFKREGMIYGVGAKIFTVAGPVILYGTVASVVVGILTYLGGKL